MPSSLPVPSKAALTALRGLVFGTSCTLAIVAEDRRRKINNAVRVIENGEKIRSAKRYRAGGTALALAMEEEALWEPGVGLPLHHHNTNSAPILILSGEGGFHGVQLHGQHGIGDDATGAPELGSTRVEASPALDQAIAQTIAQTTGNANSPPPPIQLHQPARYVGPPYPPPTRPPLKPAAPLNSGPSWVDANSEAIKAHVFPTSQEIEGMVRRACDAKDGLQMATALRTVLEAMNHKLAPDNLDESWIKVTALLCRTLQEKGRFDDAAKLLYRVINRGPIQEHAYLGHEPFVLIRSLLARTELNEWTREAYVVNVDTAVNLFVPNFTERPTGVNPEVCNLGRQLLEACFEVKRLGRIFGVYRRCNLVAGEDSSDLTAWFLTKLHEKQEYGSVIKVFCSTFAQSSPTKASARAIADIVVDSVELSHNHRPGDVLKALQSIFAGLEGAQMNPTWVIKLFISHWKKHSNFGGIEAMFEQLKSPRLEDLVHRPDIVYRIMVELALEAGNKAKADLYFEEAVAQDDGLASDVRLLGVTARFHAAVANWEAVRADFEAMNKNGTPKDEEYGRVFVPVLKAYAETHTVRETVSFFQAYAQDFKVPLCSYTVTLMAKHYGSIRDVDSLVGFLDYCSRSRFPVDAAFTNSILVRARREWKYPFRDLRTLYRKIKLLSPNFVDKHTERVMATAALSDSKHDGKAAEGRLLSLRADINKAPHQGKVSPVEDVLLAMREALACRCPQRALWIYKRAAHLNTPYSQQALKLAVRAQMAIAPNSYTAAYKLLRKAEEKGADVTPVTQYVLAEQLSAIADTSNPTSALSTVQTVLAQYLAGGFQPTEIILNHAAKACFRGGHFRGAVKYGLQAGKARGPGFNIENFRILVAAYAELVDVQGLRDIIAAGMQQRYFEDGPFRTALRRARSQITASQASNASDQDRANAREVVDAGIRAAVMGRRKLRGEGKRLDFEAIQIMTRAAAEEGCEEVDFGEVPWLGGGKKGGDAATGENGGKDKAEAVVEDESSAVLDYYEGLEGSRRAADIANV